MNNQIVFTGIGTKWVIDLYDQKLPASQEFLSQLIQNRVVLFEQHYSRFRSDSLVSQMSHFPGQYLLPDDAQPMLDLYHELYKFTDGTFTPVIGQNLVESGYDANYSLQPQALHKILPLSDVLTYTPPTSITIHKPTQLDFGGIGKGCLIDIISDLLQSQGCKLFTVDAGGDMFTTQSQRVGLENPSDSTQAIGVISITNQALAASSGNRRAWHDFHHIINPHTLSSPQHILATWVLADRTIIADALATCLFLVPPEQLMPHFDFNYLILFPDFSVAQSPNFNAELFLK